MENQTTSIENEVFELNPKQLAYQNSVLKSFKFKLFLLTKVPLGFFAGMKLLELNPHKAQASMPFKWLTQNPFKSIYFAAQSMAAELSTASLALLAIQGKKPSIATIIVGLEAEFVKKATGRTYFTCEEGAKVFKAVKECETTGEAVTVKLKTVGKMADGTVVSNFWFTWSFKQRSK
ncbi:PaaI family thioesterase [Flexithrix dorotheae]|uniref:PaaI family thioesterase n=1 Tax=Flexithrix dorotheae TaxID=70993 RepID=UPI00037F8616|nr:DUF4442 domain-containing protein [Flexithrix dorotheae]